MINLHVRSRATPCDVSQCKVQQVRTRFLVSSGANTGIVRQSRILCSTLAV